MFEYPPRTSLRPLALKNVGQLVGKRIESCSQIKHKMTCLLSNNVVAQTPLYKFVDTYRLIHVNYHSFK